MPDNDPRGVLAPLHPPEAASETALAPDYWPQPGPPPQPESLPQPPPVTCADRVARVPRRMAKQRDHRDLEAVNQFHALKAVPRLSGSRHARSSVAHDPIARSGSAAAQRAACGAPHSARLHADGPSRWGSPRARQHGRGRDGSRECGAHLQLVAGCTDLRDSCLSRRQAGTAETVPGPSRAGVAMSRVPKPVSMRISPQESSISTQRATDALDRDRPAPVAARRADASSRSCGN